MEKGKDIKTRKLTDTETARVRIDLAIRGWTSFLSAAMVVSFAVILTICNYPLFAARGTSAVCIGAIWIAVVAVDFGIVRQGLQFLMWQNARHIGVAATEDNPRGGAGDQIINLIGAAIFMAFGIAILIVGVGRIGEMQAVPQIPLSILSISLGIGSAESAALHFWFRKAGLVDVLHEMENEISV